MDIHTLLHRLAQNYRKHRIINHMSQAELAERSNLDEKYITGLENGRENPIYIALYKLSEALHLPHPMIDSIA
ncbi:helix-turn-helix transcriptional regulator [Virgibacillus sp. NKC19-16]|uniref:helix-turn-helix domain-containing protein n=1 Tax=Virgibacillus salidurans TaxID=2831673 RepID=UPI001F3DFD8F|nr:helix-turn-helix transcriptional regulator [Virgibacillus sp. NKC19-16]UJL45791.1 helix-turn-helix transcriptional regulator [Virgibacillus sp. NKC19-16]